MLIAVHKCPCPDPDCDARLMIGQGKDETELKSSILMHWDMMEMNHPEAEGLEIATIEAYELKSTRLFRREVITNIYEEKAN